MDDFKRLKNLVQMKTPDDIKEFEKVIWKLAEKEDATTLGKLIDLFDDKCPYPEVMYSLVHAIEQVPNELYVSTVLSKIKTGIKDFPFWMDCLVNGIFNHQDCLNIFRQSMHLADKESLLKLFDLMDKESPHHKELIAELRWELESSFTGVYREDPLILNRTH